MCNVVQNLYNLERSVRWINLLVLCVLMECFKDLSIVIWMYLYYTCVLCRFLSQSVTRQPRTDCNDVYPAMSERARHWC